MAVNFSKKEQKHLTLLLALAANDCYYFDQKYNLPKYLREIKELRTVENIFQKNKIQYAVYAIKRPAKLAGRRILAFRGTTTFRTLRQDIDLFDKEQVLQHFLPKIDIEKEQYGWKLIREIISIAKNITLQIRPDYVTGHSLGGILSEVVASYTNIPGMSFNSPSPVGIVTETSFLNPITDFYEGIKFEVHLRHLDPISQINVNLHINPYPIWYNGVSHFMSTMVKDINRNHSRWPCCNIRKSSKVHK